jgi:hypothetical protein|tara:strand:- start:3815 stop:4423 length:609 start_codon:yes stop_codon:yes gene_type:complete
MKFYTETLDIDFDINEIETTFGSLELQKSLFFHLPRTGGSWINLALKDISVPIDPLKKVRYGHVPFYHCSNHKKFSFSFIRNPFDWYKSLYSFFTNYNMFSRPCEINVFVQDFILKGFGLYHNTLDFFGNDYEIDFIGKYENLTSDLIKAMTLAGEVFDKETILNLSQTVVGGYPKCEDRLNDTTKDLIYKFDKKVFDTFGY